MAGLYLIRRGQIWNVDLEPVVGGEMEKVRPCVVISSDSISKTDVRLIIPLTERAKGYVDPRFHVEVAVTDAQAWDAAGLTKFGYADVLQTRCVSTKPQRFKKQLAIMNADKLNEIINRLAAVIEFEP